MSLEIQSKFEKVGGEFKIPFTDFQDKVNRLKAFVFDWDGVFNDGVKTGSEGSPYSEVDSMGLNMLRFSFYLKQGFIPDIFIVTGEHNPPALHLSKREHFKSVYLKAKVKTEALSHIMATSGLQKDEIGFMFDDILDLGLAAEVGTRFFVQRDANPLLNSFASDNQLTEYITSGSGKDNPVREVCELCIGALGNYYEVVERRVSNDSRYQDYLELRNQHKTSFYEFGSDNLQEIQYS